MTAPLILGFDTSAGHCAAALVRGPTVLEATAEMMAKGQAERLMLLLEEILARHDVSFKDLDALGIGVGPGNFTGIRIGVSAARGLALGLGIPAYGINGFEQRTALHPKGAVIAVPAPRDMQYVRHSDGKTVIVPAENVQNMDDPSPDRLAQSIALLAADRFPDKAHAPAPFYVRAPDAAPAKDAPPVILP